MNSARSTAEVRAAAKRAGRPQRTIITAGAAGDPLAMRPSRVADRLRARLLGASLDRRLAAGCPPESSPLLAARAQHIVALRSRRRLARNWENLLRTARGQGAHPMAVSVCRRQVIAAEPRVRELVRLLTAPLPVAARGVAMATAPLTDATSPVYNPRSRVSLADALDAAVAQLDPALPLMSGAPSARGGRLPAAYQAAGQEARTAGSSCLTRPVTLPAESLSRTTTLAARSGIQAAKDR